MDKALKSCEILCKILQEKKVDVEEKGDIVVDEEIIKKEPVSKLAQANKKSNVVQQDALDKKIAEFMEHKHKVPAPEVKHD